MSELVDRYELDDRLYITISRLENNGHISQDEVLKVLRECYAYLSWSVVQEAMEEARELQRLVRKVEERYERIIKPKEMNKYDK